MKWYPWVLLAVLIASLMPTLAYSHDEWDWIRQNPETAVREGCFFLPETGI